jgi:carboxyl-terminal processing protease
MQRLVLDLRNNPGGLLDQAVAVSERFLEAGQMVVYTRGRVSHANVQFTASGGRAVTDVPLIVLVDGGSASASEIVAGAIQDHDRGLIVGKRTWGKGLVQSVYNLPGDTAMALTTARYYTPSGRLIQRDYTSLYDYYNPDDDRDYSSGPTLKTDLGREVHGGGGIAPDVEVEPKKIPQIVQELDMRHQAFFGFGNLLVAAHRGLTSSTAAEEGSTPFATEPDPLVVDLIPEEGIRPGWRADERVREAFFSYMEREEIEVDRDEVQEAWSFIARLVESEVATGLWGLQAGYRVLIEGDHQLIEALNLFPEAEHLAHGDLPAQPFATAP